MKKLRLLLGILALSCLLSLPATAQQTQPASPSTPLVTPALLPVSPLATQIGATLQTLVGVPSSQPTASSANDNSEDNVGQMSDVFATDILDTLGHIVDVIKTNSATLGTNLTALPDLKAWIEHQQSDPHRQVLWNALGNDLIIAVFVPLLTAIALGLLFLPVRLKLKRNKPHTLPGRVGLLASLFLLRLTPIILFLGLGLLLLDQNEVHKLPRFVILGAIYVLALSLTVHEIMRSLFAPTAPHLRLFSFTNLQATSLYRWFSAFTFVIAFGYFLIDVATALRIPLDIVVIFQNILALVLTIMTIIVIFRIRPHVASILRGKVEVGAETETASFGIAMRAWLARHWHQLATSYLIISLAVTLLGIDNGFALMLRGTILSIFILVAARLCFLVLDLWTAPSATNAPLLHRQLLSFLLRPAIWIAALIAIAATWGFHFSNFVSTATGQRTAGAILSIALTLFILTVLYEMLNASIDRHLNRSDKNSKIPVASARARTLLPMVRNSVFILFCGIAVLACLSAVGFNIAPLLAGAGVIGVAIGFGSQTLVKDFLTGLFIVVENTIAVGDVVKIDSFSGVVEALSVRTIRLRDSDGSMHILPFSEVTKITNMTKGFAYALVDIGVSYDSDLEHVMQVLRDVGAQIQEDPVFKRVIMEPIEVMGVENLGDSSITIRARMRTRPGKQWDVRRLLLLRIKQRFDLEKIELPFPTVTHITKNVT